MHTDKPQLYATLTNAAEKSVRHLLVFFVDGSRETQLVQISDGVESLLLTRHSRNQKGVQNEKLEPSSKWPRRRMDIGFSVHLKKYSARDVQNSNG